MLNEISKNFERDGFVHLPGFFDAGLMDELNRLISAHFGDAPDYEHDDAFISESQCEIIPWFPQREGVIAFDAVSDDPRLHEVTEAAIGKGWGSQYSMVMFSNAGTSGQAWHQDCPPEDAGRFNLNRLVYTAAIREEIGGQVIVMPGAHRRGAVTVGEPHEDLPGQVVLTPGQGDLILLHGHCWHRVTPIKSGSRTSTNFRAAPAGVPDDITDVCVYRNMRYRFSTAEIVEERV